MVDPVGQPQLSSAASAMFRRSAAGIPGVDEGELDVVERIGLGSRLNV